MSCASRDDRATALPVSFSIHRYFSLEIGVNHDAQSKSTQFFVGELCRRSQKFLLLTVHPPISGALLFPEGFFYALLVLIRILLRTKGSKNSKMSARTVIFFDCRNETAERLQFDIVVW